MSKVAQLNVPDNVYNWLANYGHSHCMHTVMATRRTCERWMPASSRALGSARLCTLSTQLTYIPWRRAVRSLVIIIMRPSSLGGGRILRRTLSVRLFVRLSVCPSVRPSRYRASRRAT